MKRIYKFFAVVVALMICGIHIPTETCNALTPIEIAEIYHMINERIVAEKGVGIDVTVENGAVEEAWINRGVYWFVINHSDGLRNDINALNDRVSAIEGGVGASSADVSEIKDGVNNTNTKLDEVQNAVNNIDVQKEMEAVGEQIVKENDGKLATKIYGIGDVFVGICNGVWKLIGEAISNYGINGIDTLQINVKDYAAGTIYEAMKLFAYSLVLLCFAVNLVEATVKYEMLSLKSVIIITARVAISKLLIDNSGNICIKILDVFSDQTQTILAGTPKAFEFTTGFGNFFYSSKVKFIGPLIDMLLAILFGTLVVTVTAVVLIVAACVLIKLVLRIFELLLMISTAPVFVACWSSEVTKQYARNFFVTFIQVAAEILYIAIVYAVGLKYISLQGNAIKSWEDFFLWLSTLLPQVILVVGWCIMMIKPPKVLKNLIH